MPSAKVFCPEKTRQSSPNRTCSFACQESLLRAQNYPSLQPAFPAGLEGLKFPYIRKFISLRKKIFRRAEGEKFSCPRKEISMRTKINFRAHENIFSCAYKFCALPTEVKRRSVAFLPLCPVSQSSGCDRRWIL